MTNPFMGFIRTILLLLFRKIVFDKTVVGKTIIIDNHLFNIFRRVVVRGTAKPKAYFIVRFRPLKMTPEQNIRFSIIPMMIFMGFKGFCSKYWAVDYKTGLCQGLYEWETVEDATRYSKSIAMRFMNNRSDPKSVGYNIIDKDITTIEIQIK